MQALLISMLVFVATEPQVVWQKILGDTIHDEALHGMALEFPLALYVAGEDSLKTKDIAVLKFALDGELVRSFSYDDGGKADIGKDVDIGEEGNLYVVGYSLDSTLLFLKFDSLGDKIWDRRMFSHLGGHVLYSEDGVYFAGWYYLISNPDLRITKYDKDGNMLWSDFWQPVGDQSPTGLAVDSKESIVFVGVRFPYMWGSWREDGSPRVGIIPRYERETAHGEGIALNLANDIFTCGDLGVDSRSFMLIKNDTLGEFLWTDSAKVYDLGADEHCRGIKLDSISDCYLAGWQVRGTEEDVALIKTDSAGTLLWGWVDTMPGKQEIEAIEVDSDGYIYLAGSHYNGSNWDMLVMKVRQPLTISGLVTDSLGKPMKGITVQLTGDTALEAVTDDQGRYTLEVYNGGSYILKPAIAGWAFEPASRAYSPLAHREFNQDFLNGRWTPVTEEPIDPSVTLEVDDRYIRFALHQSLHVRLAIYDVCGRQVCVLAEGTYSAENHTFAKPDLEPGVYFVRLEGGSNFIRMRRFVSLR